MNIDRYVYHAHNFVILQAGKLSFSRFSTIGNWNKSLSSMLRRSRFQELEVYVIASAMSSVIVTSCYISEFGKHQKIGIYSLDLPRSSRRNGSPNRYIWDLEQPPR